jgi:hypothetical protein
VEGNNYNQFPAKTHFIIFCCYGISALWQYLVFLRLEED